MNFKAISHSWSGGGGEWAQLQLKPEHSEEILHLQPNDNVENNNLDDDSDNESVHSTISEPNQELDDDGDLVSLFFVEIFFFFCFFCFSFFN